MSKIVVKTEDLKKYGEDLEAKANELTALIASMNEVIASIEGGWDGYDAQNFISNASCYTTNLKSIEQALLQFGNVVKNSSVNYDNRCATFYSILGG